MKTYITTFTVSGTGQFPFDMLRYDRCWPMSSEEAAKLLHHGRRSIIMQMVEFNYPRGPSFDRWASFMWKVDPDYTTSEPY